MGQRTVIVDWADVIDEIVIIGAEYFPPINQLAFCEKFAKNYQNPTACYTKRLASIASYIRIAAFVYVEFPFYLLQRR